MAGSGGRRVNPKLSGRLQELWGAKREGGVLGDIKAYWLKKADAPSDRRMDIIHPSEMSHDDWCPRQTYYRIRDVRAGKEIAQEKHGLGTLAIFEEGHAQHDKYQTTLREMGVLKGTWNCRECASKDIAFGHDPGACPRCGSTAGVTYGEVPLGAIDSHLIGGHADGWVGRRLLEFKTVGLGTYRMSHAELLKRHTHKTVSGKELPDLTGLWNDLSKPFRPHIKQGNIYLWLAGINDIDVDEMEYVYEYKPNQQTRNYVIRQSERVLGPLLAKAATIKIGLVKGEPPEREFKDPERNPCKNCTWLKECYGAEDPPQPESGDSPEGSKSRGTRAAKSRRALRTNSSGRESDAISSRHHRAGRPDADGAVHGDYTVVQLPRDIAGSGTGRRKVRRIRPGDSPLRRNSE